MATQMIEMERLQNKAHLHLLSKVNKLTNQIRLSIFMKLKLSKIQDRLIRNFQMKP